MYRGRPVRSELSKAVAVASKLHHNRHNLGPGPEAPDSVISLQLFNGGEGEKEVAGDVVIAKSAQIFVVQNAPEDAYEVVVREAIRVNVCEVTGSRDTNGIWFGGGKPRTVLVTDGRERGWEVHGSGKRDGSSRLSN